VQGSEVLLSTERPAVALGRDASADLVIKERMASRAHGKIERRLDKFILTDHSANGTFVTNRGRQGDRAPARGIHVARPRLDRLRQSRATATDVVEFFCE